MSDKNQLHMKLNITWAVIISGTDFITQCAYSEIVMPIEVCLLVYTVPLWTIIFSEKKSCCVILVVLF